jgi:hypothetical protein
MLFEHVYPAWHADCFWDVMLAALGIDAMLITAA